MIDQLLELKPGFKCLPSANSWPMSIEGNVRKVIEPKELVQCREQGHRLSSYSTRYGYHHYWCQECKIEYFMDSGD